MKKHILIGIIALILLASAFSVYGAKLKKGQVITYPTNLNHKYEIINVGDTVYTIKETIISGTLVSDKGTKDWPISAIDVSTLIAPGGKTPMKSYTPPSEQETTPEPAKEVGANVAPGETEGASTQQTGTGNGEVGANVAPDETEGASTQQTGTGNGEVGANVAPDETEGASTQIGVGTGAAKLPQSQNQPYNEITKAIKETGNVLDDIVNILKGTIEDMRTMKKIKEEALAKKAPEQVKEKQKVEEAPAEKAPEQVKEEQKVEEAPAEKAPEQVKEEQKVEEKQEKTKEQVSVQKPSKEETKQKPPEPETTSSTEEQAISYDKYNEKGLKSIDNQIKTLAEKYGSQVTKDENKRFYLGENGRYGHIDIKEENGFAFAEIHLPENPSKEWSDDNDEVEKMYFVPNTEGIKVKGGKAYYNGEKYDFEAGNNIITLTTDKKKAVVLSVTDKGLVEETDFKDGYPTKVTETNFNGEKTIKTYSRKDIVDYDAHYDSKGNLVYETEYNDEKSKEFGGDDARYYYDKNGIMTRMRFGNDGNFAGVPDFKVDSTGEYVTVGNNRYVETLTGWYKTDEKGNPDYDNKVKDKVLKEKIDETGDTAWWYALFAGRDVSKRGTLGLSSEILATVFSAYQPRTAISLALFGKSGLNKWVEDVDQIFARAYLGTEYWASDICRKEFKVTGKSTVFIETPTGLVQFIGHIEGEKTPLLPDKTRFYKIMFGVTAPSDQKLTPLLDEKGAVNFNVYLYGKNINNQQISIPLFVDANKKPKLKELKNGESYSATGNSTLVKYSINDYNSICIVFNKKPVDRKGNPVNKICNAIPESMRSVENYEKSIESGTSDFPQEEVGKQIDTNTYIRDDW